MTPTKQDTIGAKLLLTSSYAKEDIKSIRDHYQAIERMFELECKKDVVSIPEMKRCFLAMRDMIEFAIGSYHDVAELVEKYDVLKAGK
jgi:hypothetical protein